MLHHKNRSKNF